MVSSESDKAFSRHSRRQKVHVRPEPGTCNVCSAPCSSCLHVNRVLMASKTDESSGETSRENTFSYSVNDVTPTVKSTACEFGHHAASEASNLVSVNSSHDSLSENAESKTGLRTDDASGAFQDVEIPPKLSGGTVREDQHTSKLQCDSDKRNLKVKCENPSLEGHDDNISCVSRANDHTKLSSSDIGNKDSLNLPCCSASATGLVSDGNGKTIPSQTSPGYLDGKCYVERSQNKSSRQSTHSDEYMQKVHPRISLSTDVSSHNSGLMENPSSKVTGNGAVPLNVQLKDLEVDSCSRLQGEPPECTRDHLGSLQTNEVISGTLSGKKSASYACHGSQDSEAGLDGGNSEASTKISSKLIAHTDNDACDLPAEALNSVKLNQEVDKVRESRVLHDAKETSSQSHPVDESDESDIVEQDVKVCDICGDAGREDLLAVCCRCSDGAEHTYCMRERMDEVPEGDWLCEECMFDDEIKSQKQDIFGTVEGVEKNQSSGQAGTENTDLCVNADAKASDVDGNKTSKDRTSVKASCKRLSDDTEVSSAAKKQALEPTTGSPKTSSPSRIGALSRDSSFKNLDRGKVKPAHQIHSGTRSIDDAAETAYSPTTGPRLQTPRGAFFKSNSFNSSNAKPKVKLVDEVPQKLKSTKESVSIDTKEGAGRVIGKSMSFKSAYPGRLNTSESKVKMLSPKSSPVQDLRGVKHTKERSFYERKNSFKSDRPFVNSTASMQKVDQKLASRSETASVSSTSNTRELKTLQSDSKSVASSKSTNHVSRRGSEMPLGEFKRQLSSLSSPIGASSVNGTSNSVEQKPVQGLKNDSLSNSLSADGSLYNVNQSLPDESPRPRESINLTERIKESSITRPRQSITPVGRSVPSEKCKEIDHSSQFCTVDSPRSVSLDASAAKSSREAMNKGSKLKAAIEAAMLKKPGIYRKNRVPDQSDELSVSSMNSEVPSQDQLSSIYTRNLISRDDVNEGPAINADSCKQATCNNIKQCKVLPAETVAPRTGSTRASSDGKPSMMDLHSHASAAMSVLLKMSAIPEHEYVWQGSFEVHSSGKTPNICDGFQAHLSTCASPRVLEAANKFSHKVMLNEVPRLSTWPIQFEQNGVKEDNIALYFFAKDLESFEKSYKILLENMMRSDLALKGNIDGVELLIFPSNQLPEKCQRWNMLYYLWGVFRGKRVNCSQQVPASPKFCIPRNTPTAIMSLPESICSPRPIDEDLSTCDIARDAASKVHALVDLPSLSSTETINGDCDTKVSSVVPLVNCLLVDIERQDCRPDSVPTIQKSSAQPCPEEGLVDFDCKLDTEQHASQVRRTVIDSNGSEKMPIDLDAPLEEQQSSSEYVNKVPSGAQDVVATGSVSEKNILEENNTKELNSWHVNHKKRSFVDSTPMYVDSTPTEIASKAIFAGTSQTTFNDANSVSVDGGNACKKQKTGFGVLYGCNDYTSSSSIRENRCDEATNEAAIPKNSLNAERYFFPVGPHPENEIRLDGKSIPWIGLSSVNEDRPPNLELALGAETKPSKQGIPPFLVGKVEKRNNNHQDQPPDKALAAVPVATNDEEDDDISASLSLSLAFPFSDKDRAVQSVTKREQLLPERRHVNPSLLLFGSFSDK